MAEDKKPWLYVDGDEISLRDLTISEIEYIEQYTGLAIGAINFNSITGRKPLVIVLRRRKSEVADTAFDDMSLSEFDDIFAEPAKTPVPTTAAKSGKTKAEHVDEDETSE